jgi:hypothetical protein
MLPLIKECTVLDSCLADLADSAHPTDPTTPFQSAKPLSSNLLGSAVGQGEMQYAELSLCV